MAEVEGVVSHLRANAQGYHWLVFEDGREFALITRSGMPYTKGAAEVLKLYGKHVRFPVGASGNVAGRPKVVGTPPAKPERSTPSVVPEPPSLREADTARPVKDEPLLAEQEPAPWDSQQEHDAWNRYVEDQARSGSEATEPATKRDLEGLERKLDEGIEKVVTVVIAASGVGEGEVVEGAEQVLVDHDEGRQDE
jgi:hypothetical protein